MIAGLGEATAPAGRGRLRASHADREHAIDTLKAAFVQGRLAKEEFGARIGQALTARTHADLAAVTADIPAGAGIPGGPPPRRPTRTLTWAEKAVAWGLYSIVMTVILTIAIVPGQTTIGAVVVTAAVVYAIFWLLGGIVMVASRHGWPRPAAGPVSRARGGASPPPRHPGQRAAA